MNGKEESQGADDPTQAAYAAFRDAWISGKHLDADAFCRDHPECGSVLRERIYNFLKVAGLFPEEDILGDGAQSEISEDGEAPKGRIIGDFRILREIGRGGMGVVYEAEQVSLQRKVALKVLTQRFSFFHDSVKKFYREAEAGGRQSHPGIVSVYAVGEHEGIYYIAQELVEGGTNLAHRLEELRKQENLPKGHFRWIAKLIADVADALHHAHTSGVIHRDVKPSNILITKEGTPRLTDFGLARVEDALSLSRTGETAGTPQYMSPEQITGRKSGIDARTDVFSLGVTLYECLTHKTPFEADTSHEIMNRVIFDEPVDPCRVNPRVPNDLSIICLKAMEKKPAARYATMEDFAADLNRYLSGEIILARPAGMATKFWKRLRRNSWITTAAAVALIALIGLILSIPWYISNIKQEEEVASNAKIEADKHFELANSRFEEIIRLSDIEKLTQLEEEEEKLWPAHPDQVPRMEKWLEEAKELVSRLDIHRATYQELRESAVVSDETDPEETSWNSEANLTLWQCEILQALIEGIEALSDESDGLMKQFQERIRTAHRIYRKSIVESKEKWDFAIESIADIHDCPKYKGFRLKRQVGLVPLGKNSRSGLWEFAHLQTERKIARHWVGNLKFTEECGLVFVLIPGGIFDMGATPPNDNHPLNTPNVDPNALPNEAPVHPVNIEPFFMSKYEMTQGQWKYFTGTNPSLINPKDNPGITLDYPVENINWYEAVEVLDRLGLRLPSESEWEYAARAGTTTIWWTGNEKETLVGTINLADLAFKKNRSMSIVLKIEEWIEDGWICSAPVDKLEPNPFGLHHIYGNVQEWCRDHFHENYNGAPADGSPWENVDGMERVFRGGAYAWIAIRCRSAGRSYFMPRYKRFLLGVRPAKSINKIEWGNNTD